MNTEIRDHFVYRCYDNSDVLLYVGCSRDPEGRRKGHKGSRADWYPYMTRAEMSGPFTYTVARRLEREQIETLHPRFNETLQDMGRRSRYNALSRHLEARWSNTPGATHVDFRRWLTEARPAFIAQYGVPRRRPEVLADYLAEREQVAA